MSFWRCIFFVILDSGGWGKGICCVFYEQDWIFCSFPMSFWFDWESIFSWYKVFWEFYDSFLTSLRRVKIFCFVNFIYGGKWFTTANRINVPRSSNQPIFLLKDIAFFLLADFFFIVLPIASSYLYKKLQNRYCRCYWLGETSFLLDFIMCPTLKFCMHWFDLTVQEIHFT